MCALRPFQFGPGPRSERRLPGGRMAGQSESARILLDAHHTPSGNSPRSPATDWLKPTFALRTAPTPPPGSARCSTNRTPATCSKPCWRPQRSELTSRGSTPPSFRCCLGTDSASSARSDLVRTHQAASHSRIATCIRSSTMWRPVSVTVYFAADSHLFQSGGSHGTGSDQPAALESARGRGCRCSSDPASPLHRRRSRTHHPDRPPAQRMISTGDQPAP